MILPADLGLIEFSKLELFLFTSALQGIIVLLKLRINQDKDFSDLGKVSVEHGKKLFYI